MFSTISLPTDADADCRISCALFDTVHQIHHSQTATTQLITQLSHHDPTFTQALSVHRTNYPHVSPASLILPTHYEGVNGRRKRIPGGGSGGHYTSINANPSNANQGANTSINAARERDRDANSPVKRRRVDDDTAPGARTPKGKEKERERLLEKQEREARMAAGSSKTNRRLYVTNRVICIYSSHFMSSQAQQPAFPDTFCTVYRFERYTPPHLHTRPRTLASFTLALALPIKQALSLASSGSRKLLVGYRLVEQA